ncbi:hypothetical protein [Micromonospora polyrhachis]|uniref:Cytoskeletal protein RodZ n=1 Tax=Micromonospora polyrhachis TaxID=1282883 RepID=A0A7W7SVX0_9ACTN|nr:hypothetical protein [Micromonospora polyrhachis]MBB4961571.1 cytoskeletal protein RodZ [Micromonospora polyrhachis]
MTSETPEPEANTPEPEASTPEPEASTPEPETSTPEPEASTPEREPTATVAITTPQTATKVRVDTPGVTVEIEAHEPLEQVVTTAMRLFHEAGGWPQESRYAAGFAQVERRDTPPTQASSMPYGPGPYPVQAP